MTTAQIQTTIETVARQAGIPEDQRRSWVAGAKWGLAQRYAEAPQPRLPPEAVMGGVEWAASHIAGRIDCPDCVRPTGSAT